MATVNLNLIPVDETQLVLAAGDDTQLVLSAGDETQIVLSSVAISNGLMMTDGSNSALALGSAGTPSLKFAGDANTGIFSPGADQLAISTAGTGRLFVDASGRVGIGVTPTTTLDVAGPIRSLNGTIDARLQAGYSGAVGIGAQSNDAVLFIQNATERLRITSAGLVGIGTSTVQTGHTLQVNGIIASVTSFGAFTALQAAGGTGFRWALANDGTFRLQRTTDGFAGAVTTPLMIDASSRVGIGTTSPAVPLDVVGQIRSVDGTVDTRLQPLSGSNAAIAGTWSNHAYVLYTNNTERLRITSAGNVGIGTASPGGRLQINIQDGFLFDVGAGAYTYMRFGSQSTAEGVAELAFDRAAGAVALKTGSTGSTLNTRLSIDAAGATIINNQSGTERARIDSSGRLLVGTSAARTTYLGAGISAGINVEAAGNLGANNRSISVVNGFAANTDGAATIYLGRTRSDTIGGTTIVQNNDGIGQIAFVGSDGTNMLAAAQIKAEVDGTPGSGDMPGRLLFFTTADGASSPTERMRITSTGNVGIGTGSPASRLHVAASTAVDVLIQSSNSNGDSYFGAVTGGTIYGPYAAPALSTALVIGTSNATPLCFYSNAQERARMDSSGRLLVGTSSARANYYSSVTPGGIQVETGTQSLFQNSNNATGSAFYLGKSRGATVNSNTVVQADDQLGALVFFGADGTNVWPGAQITAAVDGTPGANDMPGRLVFLTTADGVASPTERMRITNDGVIAHDQPAPAAVNATATLTIANLKTGIITSTSAAATDMTLPTGTDTQAGFSGTYDNFTFEWSVINTGPSLVRVLAGTAHTIVGSGSVATGTSGRFASRRTAANTFVTYRLT